MSDVESSLCVVGIPQSSWAAFPPQPQTEIRFSQITSEWMLNTAGLASLANRGSGLHVDVPSRVSPDRFVWSVWRPVYEYLGIDSTYTHHTQTRAGTRTTAQIHTLRGNKERKRWITTMLSLMKTFPGCHGNCHSQPNDRFHHLSRKDDSYLSCPTFNSKMIWYQMCSTRVHKRLGNLSWAAVKHIIWWWKIKFWWPIKYFSTDNHRA